MDANEIRRQWLAEMGLEPEEIEDVVARFPAWDPVAERRELDAIRDIVNRINPGMKEDIRQP